MNIQVVGALQRLGVRLRHGWLIICPLLLQTLWASSSAHASPNLSSHECATYGGQRICFSDVLERARSSLAKIDVSLSRIQGAESNASGFVAVKSNWVVTNVHAIDPIIVNPGDFQLTILGARDERLNGRVVALDLANDLALLESDLPLRGKPLPLAGDGFFYNQPAYSMGSTSSDGYLVVEGKLAGPAPGTEGNRLLFQGTLRSGMSGGPVLNPQGMVVAVNQSSSSKNPELGFLVALGPLKRLLEQASLKPYLGQDEMQADVSRQLQAMAAKMAGKAGNKKNNWRALGPFQVAALLSDCPGRRFSLATERFDVYRIACSSEFWTVEDDVMMILPSFELRHYWVRNPSANAVRGAKSAAYLLEYLRDINGAAKRDTGSWECRYSRMTNRHGLALDLHACRRGRMKHPGFYDHRMRALGLASGPDTIVSMLDLNLVDNKSAQVMAQIWLDGLVHGPSNSSAKGVQ